MSYTGRELLLHPLEVLLHPSLTGDSTLSVTELGEERAGAYECFVVRNRFCEGDQRASGLLERGNGGGCGSGDAVCGV